MQPNQNPIDFDSQGNLLIPSVKSPNFVSGTSGWTIKKDGSAEFNNIVIRGGSVTDNTAFYYNGTPANGNLIASISPVAGTDPYGNQYLAGVCTYGVSGVTEFFAAMNSGSLSIGKILDQANSGGVGFGFYDVASVQRPSVVIVAPNGTNPSVMAFVDITGEVFLTDTHGTSRADLYVSGAIRHTDLQGNSMTKQTPSLGSGWVAGPQGGSYRALQYWIDGIDNLVISGTIHCTTATPSSTVFTLPSAYLPKADERPPVTSNFGGTYAPRSLQINHTTGAVVIDPVPTTSGTDVYIYASVPLGNNN